MAHEVKIEFRASEEPEVGGKYRVIAVVGPDRGVTPIGRGTYGSPDAAVAAFCRAIGAAMDANRA